MPEQHNRNALLAPVEKSYRVSIGMPVFNGSEKIQRALDSLLAQKFDDYEIIISDNCSTDATRSIIQAYAKEHEHVRVTYQSENVGALANFRRVLDKAGGEYFFWAPHDDRWPEDFVETAVKTLDRYPDAAGCLGTVQYIDREGRIFATSKPPYGLECSNAFQRVRNYLLNGTTDNLIYGVFRRNVLLNAPFVSSIYPEKCIIMHAILSGPIVDAEDMEYFNDYAFKTPDEIVETMKIGGHDFDYEIPVFKQIVHDLKTKFGLLAFLQLFVIFVLKNNWHKAYVKNVLKKLGIPL